MVVNQKKALLDQLIKTETVNAVLFMIKKKTPITMEGIAEQCGIAKGTLYNYFKNKEALMDYVHQAILRPIKESKAAILESQKDPVTRLYEFIDAMFEFQEDVHLYFRFMEQIRSVASEKRERDDIIMLPMIRLCRQGIEENQFIKIAPEIMAEAIYGMTVGPLKALPVSEFKKQNLEKIKQDILCMINKIIIA